MPRPAPDPAKLDHAAELYAAGKSFKEAATEVGLHPESVRIFLKRRGIEARPRASRPAHNRIDPPDSDFIDQYISGVSEKELAASYGVSRPVMSRWLGEAGVKRRSIKEANALRMASLSDDQRQRIVMAAHAAVRGKRQTERHREKIALARERVGYGGQTSPGTDRLANLLTERSLEHVREKAVGRYNVDIALSAYPVAVEVLGGNWHAAKPIHAKRTPYILDRGWHLLFVWNTKRCEIGAKAADYIVAFAEETRINPPSIGQYRVIRGDGQLIAAGQADDEDFTLVPPPVTDLR